jgi:hypothetical protein
MSAKDRFHDAVKTALIKEGWTITHEPLDLDFDSNRIQIDLAGEKLIAPEKGVEKFAVGVKNFCSPSTIYEFYLAVGQCFSYSNWRCNTAIGYFLKYIANCCKPS